MVGFIVRCSPTLDVNGLPPSTQTDILAKLLTHLAHPEDDDDVEEVSTTITNL
ncbi:hypothetical protein PGTUg99_020581 [Puccinia graminis f. sp. tritici]|uniref:Uncharacterized protein n=1 Tax=Puccinia graminis f. sp. tritici TaxID=56615 RepID=A0A5B0QKH5_PUCGR|nr:hypothetical protein PGTUg99_020581 [Puccinia graminis f. sp. tritici]